MKLTRIERSILANQYKILELLDPDEAQAYQEAQTILREGYELHYGDLPGHVYPDAETMSEEECREVLNILDMFYAIQLSYQAISDKSGIDQWRTQFRGFDGNNETKQMAYARFYCSMNGGRYQNLERPEDFNSHSQVLDRYKAMLRRWQALDEPWQMSGEQLQQVIGN